MAMPLPPKSWFAELRDLDDSEQLARWLDWLAECAEHIDCDKFRLRQALARGEAEALQGLPPDLSTRGRQLASIHGLPHAVARHVVLCGYCCANTFFTDRASPGFKSAFKGVTEALAGACVPVLARRGALRTAAALDEYLMLLDVAREDPARRPRWQA